MFRLAYFEAIKDIKSSFKGLKLIIISLEFFLFIIIFSTTSESYDIGHAYILMAIAFTFAFILRPKMCKIIFLVPIRENVGYKYFKYKGWIALYQNIIIYLALSAFNSVVFKLEYMQFINILFEEYLPILIIICSYVIALTNRVVQRWNKIDWLLGACVIIPMFNFEFGIMRMLNNNIIGLIIIALSYISAIIVYIIIKRKVTANFYTMDYNMLDNYSKLKNILGDYTKKEYESYYGKRNKRW